MPLTPLFSTSQSALTPSMVTVVDASTGSDAAVTKRRIFFQTATGNYLVEDGVTTDYEEWALAETSKTWDILDYDHALSVTIQWLSVTNDVLYTLTQVFCFSQNNKQFFYYLVQQQALTPSILKGNVYFSNMATYWMNITGAIEAITIGADVSASQSLLDAATFMQQNQIKFF